MSRQTRASHPIHNLLPTEIEGLNSLAELTLDMRWSWNHTTDAVWQQLDALGIQPEVRHLNEGHAARSTAGYTARIIPHCDGVAIPLEDARILWRR